MRQQMILPPLYANINCRIEVLYIQETLEIWVLMETLLRVLKMQMVSIYHLSPTMT